MSLLSIVLPAYNEEQNIANTAKVLGELLDRHGIDYELVFISDGSKDGTFDRIKEEAAKNPRVRGAEFSRNFGKEEIGRASVGKECVRLCRSRWSPYH